MQEIISKLAGKVQHRTIIIFTLPGSCGPQSAKTDLRVKIFRIGFLAQNSSLGLVDNAQSENISGKQEYMP